jgi:ESS family glutamate:Na+ symporter
MSEEESLAFWQQPAGTVISLGVIAAAAAAARRCVPFVSIVPTPVLAGLFGLFVGNDFMGLLPLEAEVLESMVYHALTLVNIAIGLQRPRSQDFGACSLSFGCCFPFFFSCQMLLGISLALAIGAHPGLGVLLPLGFEQGPGQALSIGSTWVTSGALPYGDDLGLLFGDLGFMWALLVGVPLAHLGRSRGQRAVSRKAAVPEGEPHGRHGGISATLARSEQPHGALDPLTMQLAVVMCIEGVVYLFLRWLIDVTGFGVVLWAVSYQVGMLLAYGFRLVLTALDPRTAIALLDDQLLGNIAGISVDVCPPSHASVVHSTDVAGPHRAHGAGRSVPRCPCARPAGPHDRCYSRIADLGRSIPDDAGAHHHFSGRPRDPRAVALDRVSCVPKRAHGAHHRPLRYRHW